jgi:hypothetical protein
VTYLNQASHTDPIIEDLLFDEDKSRGGSAVGELLSMIRADSKLRHVRSRSPSMLADGFGYIGLEPSDGSSGQAPAPALAKLLVKLARFVNPF